MTVLTVPATVIVKKGLRGAPFVVKTLRLKARKVVAISAQLGGAAKSG